MAEVGCCRAATRVGLSDQHGAQRKLPFTSLPSTPYQPLPSSRRSVRNCSAHTCARCMRTMHANDACEFACARCMRTMHAQYACALCMRTMQLCSCQAWPVYLAVRMYRAFLTMHLCMPLMYKSMMEVCSHMGSMGSTGAAWVNDQLGVINMLDQRVHTWILPYVGRHQLVADV